MVSSMAHFAKEEIRSTTLPASPAIKLPTALWEILFADLVPPPMSS